MMLLTDVLQTSMTTPTTIPHTILQHYPSQTTVVLSSNPHHHITTTNITTTDCCVKTSLCSSAARLPLSWNFFYQKKNVFMLHIGHSGLVFFIFVCLFLSTLRIHGKYSHLYRYNHQSAGGWHAVHSTLLISPRRPIDNYYLGHSSLGVSRISTSGASHSRLISNWNCKDRLTIIVILILHISARLCENAVQNLLRKSVQTVWLDRNTTHNLTIQIDTNQIQSRS